MLNFQCLPGGARATALSAESGVTQEWEGFRWDSAVLGLTITMYFRLTAGSWLICWASWAGPGLISLLAKKNLGIIFSSPVILDTEIIHCCAWLPRRAVSVWQEELFQLLASEMTMTPPTVAPGGYLPKLQLGAGGLFLSSFHLYNCLSRVPVRDITVVVKRLNDLHLTQGREILIALSKTTSTGEVWRVLYFSEDRLKILTQRRNALSLFPSTAMASWSPDTAQGQRFLNADTECRCLLFCFLMPHTRWILCLKEESSTGAHEKYPSAGPVISSGDISKPPSLSETLPRHREHKSGSRSFPQFGKGQYSTTCGGCGRTWYLIPLLHLSASPAQAHQALQVMLWADEPQTHCSSGLFSASLPKELGDSWVSTNQSLLADREAESRIF